MSKLFTPVHALAILAFLSAPGAFAGGRDGGGNGDNKAISASDEFGSNREINKKERCVEDSFTADEARRCEMSNGNPETDL